MQLIAAPFRNSPANYSATKFCFIRLQSLLTENSVELLAKTKRNGGGTEREEINIIDKNITV